MTESMTCTRTLFCSNGKKSQSDHRDSDLLKSPASIRYTESAYLMYPVKSIRVVRIPDKGYLLLGLWLADPEAIPSGLPTAQHERDGSRNLEEKPGGSSNGGRCHPCWPRSTFPLRRFPFDGSKNHPLTHGSHGHHLCAFQTLLSNPRFDPSAIPLRSTSAVS